MSERAVSDVGSTIDLATTALPLSARMPRGSLMMVWWSQCGAMFYLFLGAALALKYGTLNALTGMLISAVMYSIINGVLARYAVRTGLSCSALSQAMLGSAGGAFATLILCLMALFYAVFEGSVLAVTMSKVIPGMSYLIAAVLIAFYSVPLVLGSVQHWLNRFNAVLLPFYLLGLVLLIVLTVYRHGYSPAWLHIVAEKPTGNFGWLSCVIPYMGVFILSMCTADFARFGKPADARFHALINFGLPFYLVAFLVNGAVGIFLVGSLDAAHLTETAVVDASLAILGGAGGLAWIWVVQTRINTANYFLSTVNLQAFCEEVFHWRWSKAVCGSLVGVVVFVLMCKSDIFSYLLTALNYQGVCVAAWVGIALSHVLGQRQLQPEGGRHGAVAWIVGAISGLTVLAVGGDDSSFAVPTAFVVAAIAHRLLKRLVVAREAPAR